MTRKMTTSSSGADVSDKTLRSFMGYTIRRAANVIQTDANRRLKPIGLRMISYSVLNMIVFNPGLRQAHLAQALSIERPNLVTIVDELQAAGWVTRNPDPTDRRAFALQVTPAGRNVHDAALRLLDSHETRMMQDMTQEERRTLIRALRKIEGIGKNGD